jgi:hypothetical protein
MLQLSRREEWLLDAALNPDGAVAAASWNAWASEIQLEDAPYPELRLLTAVYAHLSHAVPTLKLPSKLRGKARATFTYNNLLAHGCLPVIKELGRFSPVLLTKGLAICIRFDAWSSREMADVDIHIESSSLEKACEVFARAGWAPRYGMTWPSLLHRSSLRRNSWNFSKGRIELDLHWRTTEGPSEGWLSRQMWAGAEPAEVFGHPLLLQSPEFAFITSLEHGFKIGSHSDALQTIVDSASLLPVCKIELLSPLLDKSDLVMTFKDLLSNLERFGLSQLVSKFSTLRGELPVFTPPKTADLDATAGLSGSQPQSKTRWFKTMRPKTEIAVLRRPIRYRLWQSLGQKSWVERLMLRLTGPFSQPLTYSGAFREDYDLRDCDVIDQIGGPGWSWPEPSHTCFWSDRADARLLIPLRHRGDHLIILGLSEHRHSPNARVDVFANGVYLTTLDFTARVQTSEYCLIVPRRALFGPWVELSLRPQPYIGDAVNSGEAYPLRRSVPVRRLRVLDMAQVSEVFSGYHVPQLYFTILKAEEPHASRFERIKRKIEESPYRYAAGIPANFNPVLYIFSYPDLLEGEVDPYEHFIRHGREEGRLWS